MSISTENGYIVRIYRREETNPVRLIGVVEDACGEGKKVFHTTEELVGILLGRKKKGDPGQGRAIAIPVIIKGADSNDRPFCEDTILTELKPEGASIALKNPPAPGSRVFVHIRPAVTGPGIPARVIQVRNQSNVSKVAISFDSGWM